MTGTANRLRSQTEIRIDMNELLSCDRVEAVAQQDIGVTLISTYSGLIISAIKPDGAAAASGNVKVGDVLVAVNGTKVTSEAHANELILGLNGTSLKAEFLRGVQSVHVTLWRGITNQVETALLRCKNEKFLRDIFDQYKDSGSNGIISSETLCNALEMSGAPCPDDREAFFARFDVNGDKCVTFDAFTRAVQTPDALESWLNAESTFKLGAFAPALRVILSKASCANNDSLYTLENVDLLDDEAINTAFEATCATLKQALMLKRNELRPICEAKKRVTDLNLQTKEFELKELSSSEVKGFYEGLDSRVGYPSLDFEKAMFWEHCELGGRNFTFSSGNPYNIRTTPCEEWSYVVPDNSGRRCEAPLVKEGDKAPFARTIHDIDELVNQHNELPELETNNKLERAEAIAIILYSGPMFTIYNGILRQNQDDEQEIYETFKRHNNLFPTTIFALASALQKLARVSRIPADTPLFRGLGGYGKFMMKMPDSFFTPDKYGCSGYTDFAFQSFTADKNEAIKYSGVKQSKAAACLLEIRPNSIDRAADISKFSQFPKEKEFTFAPCSCVQRSGLERPSTVVLEGGQVGFLTIIPASVSVSGSTETIEQMKGKKKKMHLRAFASATAETKQWLEKHRPSLDDGVWLRLFSDTRRGRYEWTGCCYTGCQSCGFQVDMDTLIYTWSIAFIDEPINELVRAMDEDARLPDNDYTSDAKYKSMVTRMLTLQQWAKENFWLWFENPEIRSIGGEMEMYSAVQISQTHFKSLKSAHQEYVSFLKRKYAGLARCSEADLKNLQDKGITQTIDGQHFIEDVQLLIDSGTHIPVADENSALLLASKNGDFARLLFLRFCVGLMHCCTGMLHNRHRHFFSVAGCPEMPYDRDPYRHLRPKAAVVVAAEDLNVDTLDRLDATVSNSENIDLHNANGMSPIHLATQEENPLPVLEFLVGCGADVNCANSEGWVPILLLVKRVLENVTIYAKQQSFSYFESSIRLLIDHGADINRETPDGCTALHLATSTHWNWPIVAVLIREGARIDAKTK